MEKPKAVTKKDRAVFQYSSPLFSVIGSAQLHIVANALAGNTPGNFHRDTPICDAAQDSLEQDLNRLIGNRRRKKKERHQ